MKKELIAEKDPKSPVAEIFRTLRTNIQFMNSQNGLKSILVTSTMPGEGKSWISANLAITFAQAGKNVVLVDADMRKGRIHKMFQTESTPGLSNFLSGVDEIGKLKGKNTLKSIIKETEIDNLFVIPAGNFPPNPSELLATEATVKMLEKLKDAFDIIILDGTPSLLVTDAIILSRIADSTIIVASHKSTKKDNLIKVKKSIENVGGKIAGVVINKIPVNVQKYKSTYYYSSNSNNSLIEQKGNINKYITEQNKKLDKQKSEEIIKEIDSFLNKKNNVI